MNQNLTFSLGDQISITPYNQISCTHTESIIITGADVQFTKSSWLLDLIAPIPQLPGKFDVEFSSVTQMNNQSGIVTIGYNYQAGSSLSCSSTVTTPQVIINGAAVNFTINKLFSPFDQYNGTNHAGPSVRYDT